MTSDEVRQAFETILRQKQIDRFWQQCGVIERQCKPNRRMFVRVMVIAALDPF
jgi:hypothetical protein